MFEKELFSYHMTPCGYNKKRQCTLHVCKQIANFIHIFAAKFDFIDLEFYSLVLKIESTNTKKKMCVTTIHRKRFFLK